MKLWRCVVSIVFCLSGIIFCLLTCIPSAARAAEAKGTRCISISSSPDRARISIRGQESSTITNRSPAVFCDLKPGMQYIMEIERNGYEKRKAKLKIGEDGKSIIIGGERMGGVARSMVLPGWGQAGNGESAWGVTALLATAGAGIGCYFAYDDYLDHRDRYYDLIEEERAAVDVSTKQALGEMILKEGRLTNSSRDYAALTAGILGWVYAGNIIETLLLSSPPHATISQQGNVELGTPRKSISRALARSIFYPGMGQKYMGHTAKGVFFQTVFLGTAFFAAKAWKDYTQATDLYEIAVQKLEDAQSLQAIEEARIEVSSRWENRRDKEKMRDAAFVSIASVWMLNVLDVLTSRSHVQSSSFEFINSYNGQRINSGICIKF